MKSREQGGSGDYIEPRVRQRLEDKKMTVSALAQEVGVSRVALYHLFKGNYSREMLEKISEVLDIPVNLLLTPIEGTDSIQSQRVVSAYQAAPAEIRHSIDLLLDLNGVQAQFGVRPAVVVVDDVKENIELLVRTLRKEFDVLEFTDPREALEAVKTKRIDAIITDQRMPGMTGTEMLTKVEKLGKPIAKMVVSGYSDNQAMLEAINSAHVDSFIMKPFDPKALKERLTQIVQAYRTSETATKA